MHLRAVPPARDPQVRDAVQRSLARQAAADGVLTRVDAVATHGRSHVDARLRARRWQRRLGSLIVTHNGPLDERQRLWVSLLAAPPGTVVGGLSAAALDGFAGFPPETLTLVAPGASRNQRERILIACDWPVQVHWSTKLDGRDVRPGANPPRTTVARSVVDAASERVAPARSRVLVLAAVQQRLATPASLWDALSRRGRCRNRAVIAESINDAAGGIESLPEDAYNRILVARGLPRPHRQTPVARPDGRYYLDNDWPDLGVRAEIHGIPHLAVQNWEHDLERQNDIAIGLGGLLVFSSWAVRNEPRRVGDQTESMLRRHGWSPMSPASASDA